MRLALAGGLLALALTGCIPIVYPVPPAGPVRGRPVSSDDTGFITPHKTTRAEVLARLGPATRECVRLPALAYSWERPATGFGYVIFGTPGVASGEMERSTWRAFFVVFDEHDVVLRKELKVLSQNKSLDEHLENWAKRHAHK
jgi:hypothetical protein